MEEIKSNGLHPIVAQAIEKLKNERGFYVDPMTVSIAELSRLTGFSRTKLTKLKENKYIVKPHASKGIHSKKSVISDFHNVLDDMLRNGVRNSSVCFERIRQLGYKGSLTTVKRYISSHLYLVPQKRQAVEPIGRRATRYITGPGELFQMDWGFTKVAGWPDKEFTAACFVMICHHCGLMYVEFFPTAKQENLFIGMIHGFQHMGIPKAVMTDNMRSVVLKRDLEGHPIWQKDYESFMKTIGFETKLHLPRHPYTKGAVERAVRFVKGNFLSGRKFWNFSDLNEAALEWCERKSYVTGTGKESTPHFVHSKSCTPLLKTLKDEGNLLCYLCPKRAVTSEGFVSFEGRRFGIPFFYVGKTVCVRRTGRKVLIYSEDLTQLLVTHDVTWGKKDSFCKDQFSGSEQLEEHPTMPVTVTIKQEQEPVLDSAFERFNFDMEDCDD